jgi:hypothetical protein
MGLFQQPAIYDLNLTRFYIVDQVFKQYAHLNGQGLIIDLR